MLINDGSDGADHRRAAPDRSDQLGDQLMQESLKEAEYEFTPTESKSVPIAPVWALHRLVERSN